MMRRWAWAAALVALAACHGAVAKPFDYYLLALSWSPEYCATARNNDEPQCARRYGLVVHGLWPQSYQDRLERCGKGEYLSDALISRMLPIMPSKRLIIHEWQTHGTCAGDSAEAYFATTERAYRQLRLPPLLQMADDYRKTSVREIKAALKAQNPAIDPNEVAVICKGRNLQEIRLCLSPTLSPQACDRTVRDRCGDSVWLRPAR